MPFGIPALHSPFKEVKKNISAYNIVIISNKILNKEPYIIAIFVQSTWVKHNPHLVFGKADKCSLSFWHKYLCREGGFGPWYLNSQSAEGGVQWWLSTGLPCPFVQSAASASAGCYQRPLTLAMSEWYWRGSLPLAPPSRNDARMLAGSNSFLRFLFSSARERKTKEKRNQKNRLNRI